MAEMAAEARKQPPTGARARGRDVSLHSSEEAAVDRGYKEEGGPLYATSCILVGTAECLDLGCFYV